jgi:hypothetical protein
VNCTADEAADPACAHSRGSVEPGAPQVGGRQKGSQTPPGSRTTIRVAIGGDASGPSVIQARVAVRRDENVSHRQTASSDVRPARLAVEVSSAVAETMPVERSRCLELG